MTVKRTWTVENKWRCDSCGTENLGRFMECQNCRSPKEKQEKDVVPSPDAAPAVTDPELLRLAAQKANWVCEFCGGQVRDEHGKCVKNCGAPKPEPEGDVRIESEDGRVKISVSGGASVSNIRVNGKQVIDADGKVTSLKDWKHKGSKGGYTPPQIPKDPAPWKLIIGLGLGLFALASLLTYLLKSWEVTAKVNSIRWSYTSDLRQKTLMHGEGWGSPAGSFNASCQRKYYGDENCNPHNCNPHSISYECNCISQECNCRTTCSDNGNGFSTCSESCSTCQSCSTCSRTEYDTCYDQCAVYKQWCSYDYYEWPIVASQKTGSFEHNEHWPDLAANGPDQRLDRAEVYEVVFIEPKVGKENWTYKPRALPEFKTFDVKQLWRLKVNRLGNVTPLRKE